MENKGITELSKEWQDILTKGCNMFKFSAEEYPEDEGKEYIYSRIRTGNVVTRKQGEK